MTSRSSNLQAFRDDVRAWLDEHAPQGLRGTRKGRFDGVWGGRSRKDASEDQLAWLNACLTRGYTAPTWPTEYGGGGLTREQARVLEDELRRAELPPPVVGFGLTMIGPTLLDFGSDAQKAEHITKIVRGETRWCQGYSEPGAGSDLAGLTCRAERDGDHLVVTGAKVWTSHADKSDWIFALVRTTPISALANKRQGITFVLIDMQSEGVSTRPIRLLSGASPFCETIFDGVRVPVANVVGEIDDGWGIAKALLGYERTMVGEAMGGTMLGMEPELLAAARKNNKLNAHTRLEIAHLSIRSKGLGAMIGGLKAAMKAGRAPGPESSAIKICGSEMKQRRWEFQAELEPHVAETRANWLRSRANTIEGGTTEIQLNIIARRILGLPRGQAVQGRRHADADIADIAQVARRFCEDRAPLCRYRAVAFDVSAQPDAAAWDEMAELGWHEVAEIGLPMTAAIVEECGRTLSPDPWIALVDAQLGSQSALVAAAALMLGAATAAFDMTLDYLRTREQFQVPIGSFQALQHRAARMFCELQLARAIVDKAAQDPTARNAAAAKHLVGTVARKVANEAVQMHGGIGVTAEHDIGLFLLAIFAWDQALGDAWHHALAYAEHGGY